MWLKRREPLGSHVSVETALQPATSASNTTGTVTSTLVSQVTADTALVVSYHHIIIYYYYNYYCYYYYYY